MPNGDLKSWLHPESSDTLAQTNTLSLEQRLHIAINIFDALDYLHNHCQPSIIPESANRTQQNSTSTTGIRGTIGYVAPGN
jgi:serine/threonine protein kinase